MKELQQEFKYKGVNFKIIKEGQNAIMLDAQADFYDCPSVEVWHKRTRPDTTIKGNFVEGGFKKPSNEDYPYNAHQFMEKHYASKEAMMEKVDKRFNEYETGKRPKKIGVLD